MRNIVVIGSGGHTTEMLKIVHELMQRGEQSFFYFSAISDATSLRRIQSVDTQASQKVLCENEHFSFKFLIQIIQALVQRIFSLFVSRIYPPSINPQLFRLPKVRYVGRAYIFSIFPAIFCFLYSLLLILYIRPTRILTNGPGICVPVVWAAYVLNALRIQRISIIYIESLTCVHHLSVSGKIVNSAADALIVHWGNLRNKYPRAIHVDHCGKSISDSLIRAGSHAYAFVTVGTTNFDSLIRECDSEWFLTALNEKFGIQSIVFQIGNGKYMPQKGKFIRWYDRQPNDVFENASLIISHGGVGTVLDASDHNKPLVAVPNESLMNNHQAAFCEALHIEKCLYSIPLSQFRATFKSLELSDLVRNRFEFPAKEICAQILNVSL